MTTTMNIPNNIWNSVEFDAISRGFSFHEYITFHGRTGSKAKPVSYLMYDALRLAFNISLEEAQSK